MDTTDSIESSVNGKPGTITYFAGSDASKSKLRFHGSDLELTSNPHEIACQNIVGIDPNGFLLYTEANPAAVENSTVSPLIFRALHCSKLPSTLLQDLTTSDEVFSNQWLISVRAEKLGLHVIISTGSGTGQAESTWKLLLKPLLDHLNLAEGDHYASHITTSDSTVTEISQNIIRPKAEQGIQQAIILLSGDGGMVDMINALLSADQTSSYKPPSVAQLPLGTGNALAHSAGITSDDTMGLRSMWTGSPKRVPIFQAKFSPGARLLVNEAREERPLSLVDGTPTAYGAVVCSWAFHAALVADSDTAEYRKFGAQRFQMAGKEALFPADGSQPHPYSGRVSILRVEGDKWQKLDRDTHGYVLATFCSYLEKGFHISPHSKPLDGQLRVVHFGPLTGEETMNAMTKAYDGGKHIHDDRVSYDDIDGLKIECQEDDARWRRFCIDGKIVRVEDAGWMEMRSSSKRVVDVIVRA